MNSRKHIMVTGVTGQQGGAVARALLKAGHTVTGMTRHPDTDKAFALKEQGISIVYGDFNDNNSLKSALQGIDVVFAMGTPYESGPAAETEQGKSIVRAAAAMQIEHFIYTSVGNADKNTGVPHFDSKFTVEMFLKETGLNTTIVAPVFFMDNLKSDWYTPSLKKGFFSHAVPADRPLQMISLNSIGNFVTEIVERGALEYGKRYDIAEDELTGKETAAILGKISGTQIVYEGFPPSALEKQSKDLALMYEWFDKVGYSVNITNLHERFPDVQWLTFFEWAVLHTNEIFEKEIITEHII